MNSSNKQFVNSIFHIRAVILLTSVLTAGCASMINPHLDVDRHRPAVVAKDQNGNIKRDENGMVIGKKVSIDEGVAYANGVKNEYRDALGEEAVFRNLLGVGLIGVATAVPVMALTDSSDKAIGITAMGGAGAYGLGTWLQSTPRQRAYIEGYKAINCAIDAVAPLRHALAGDSYDTFLAALDNVDTRIEEVNTRIGNVLKFRSESEHRKEWDDAENAIEIAEAAIREAKEARTAAVDLRFVLDALGDNLVAAVDGIICDVDEMIRRNQPELAALSSIIGGLGSIYGQLSTVPAGLIGGGEIGAAHTTDDGLKKEAKKLEPAIANLQHVVAKLATSTRQITDFVNAVIKKKPVETLKRCRVDPSLIAASLTVKPPSAAFAGGVEETRAFVIQGGAHPYRVVLLSGQEANVVVSQPDLFGPAFVVQVKADTPPATYNIYAADAAGRNTILRLAVGTPSSPEIDKDGAEFKKKNIKERKKVQEALCVEQDGIWGPKTRAALKEHEGVETMTEPLIKILLDKSDEEINKRCGPVLVKLLETIEKFLKPRVVKITKGGHDGYVGTFREIRVHSDPGEPKLSITLDIPNKPTQPVTIADLRAAVFSEAKKMHGFPPEITDDMIAIENGQALKDGGKLDP